MLSWVLYPFSCHQISSEWTHRLIMSRYSTALSWAFCSFVSAIFGVSALETHQLKLLVFHYDMSEVFWNDSYTLRVCAHRFSASKNPLQIVRISLQNWCGFVAADSGVQVMHGKSTAYPQQKLTCRSISVQIPCRFYSSVWMRFLKISSTLLLLLCKSAVYSSHVHLP